MDFKIIFWSISPDCNHGVEEVENWQGYSLGGLFISSQEGDYKMHHIWVSGCVHYVTHTHLFSKTAAIPHLTCTTEFFFFHGI